MRVSAILFLDSHNDVAEMIRREVDLVNWDLQRGSPYVLLQRQALPLQERAAVLSLRQYKF